MNIFDQTIISFFNQFSRHSMVFDLIAAAFREIDLLKGGVLCALFCYVWFEHEIKQSSVRISLISTLAACLISVTIGRMLELLLPFRPRPILSNHIDFIAPYLMDKAWFNHNSAFPSDHASLYSALSIGLFYVSRKIGLVAMFYTLVFIFLPRIYEGMHHPTDIIAGTFIGLLSLYATHTTFFSEHISAKVLKYSSQHQGIFYGLFFMLIYQISALFIDLRHIARVLIDISHSF